MKRLLLILTLFLVACTPVIEREGLTIATTFFPLYDITRQIVGSEGEVFLIVPQGTEPHDFEPTPLTVRKFHEADAYVMLGIVFASFEQDLIKSLEDPLPLISIDGGVNMLEYDSGEVLSHAELHRRGIEHDDEEKAKDPHFWLSPKSMLIMAQNLQNGLQKAFPEKADIFKANADQVIQQLEQLDQEYTVGLANCNQDTILTTHKAFAYLARDYGFTQLAISGISPEAEPSPQELVDLVQEAKEHNIQYIFVEALLDPRISETIADEIGAQVLPLNPVIAKEQQDDTYFTIMRRNLQNLRRGLECS